MVFWTSCSSSEQESPQKDKISATAQATRYSDGTIKLTEPSKDDIKSLEEFSKGLEKIEAKFPGPKLDFQKLKEFEKVEAINQDGTLLLKNGKVLGFAGCDCGNELLEYLKKRFKDENIQVYYFPSGFVENEIIFAYIWEVDIEFGDDLGSKEPSSGPTFMLLNEFAIMNKLCEPIEQTDHMYHKRYLALSRLQ